jgi:hypothetical protein
MCSCRVLLHIHLAALDAAASWAWLDNSLHNQSMCLASMCLASMCLASMCLCVVFCEVVSVKVQEQVHQRLGASKNWGMHAHALGAAALLACSA